MKKLYQARNSLDADELRRFLWARGIDATIESDAAADAVVSSSDRQYVVSVLVDDAEFDRASKLLLQFTNRLASRSLESEWTCRACAEVVGPEFDTCTKCGMRRGDVARSADAEPVQQVANDLFLHDEAGPIEAVDVIVPGANRSAVSLWLEVFVVFALTKPLWGGHSLSGFVFKSVGLRNTAANFYLPQLLYSMFGAAVMLAAMRLSGDPWAAFGIKKPAAVDIFTGCIVCVVKYGFAMMGVSIFTDILKSIFSERYIYQVAHTHDPPFHAQGWSGLVLLLVLAIVVGFSEELVVRGYLIPRLERLLQSTWASVLTSAAVFGLLHWGSGVLSMCNAFLGGIVYGIAFVWTRRLWPVAIAHSMYDFSTLLYHAN
jgi:membrane protease YdiL (CAAX protease family)